MQEVFFLCTDRGKGVDNAQLWLEELSWRFCIHFEAKPIDAEQTSATVKSFEGFVFEDLMCYTGGVWPRSCRILKSIELMEGEVVGSDSGHGSGY
uniref:Uncharacterized protein n=1 Tax=Fagus sylvatica TaxID=28930 RepID=A0A2N9EK92_FAGSY